MKRLTRFKQFDENNIAADFNVMGKTDDDAEAKELKRDDEETTLLGGVETIFVNKLGSCKWYGTAGHGCPSPMAKW